MAGTVAGRAFSDHEHPLRRGRATRSRRLWLPLLDGTERVGVMGMSFAGGSLSPALVDGMERYAHLVAMLIVTKQAYGDAFESVRGASR